MDYDARPRIANPEPDPHTYTRNPQGTLPGVIEEVLLECRRRADNLPPRYRLQEPGSVILDWLDALTNVVLATMAPPQPKQPPDDDPPPRPLGRAA